MPNAIHDVVLDTLTVKQLLESTYAVNGDPIEGVYSGAVDVSEYLGGPQDQVASFQTQDIGGVFAVSNIATQGLSISAGSIIIPLKKRQNRGTYAGAGANYSLTCANGFVVPTRFEASENGNASASLDCHMISTDGTNPVTVNVSQNVAAESYNALWGLGPVAVGGTTIPQVLGFTMNVGLTIEKQFYGKNYPSEVYVITRRPVMDIQTYDVDVLSSLGSGLASVASAVAYMRKRSGFGSGFAADASAVHGKMSFADGAVKAQAWTASGSGSATRTIRVWGEALSLSVAAIT